jgi:RNA polymerase sigma-70 factor, ECF subfamily
MDDVPMPHFGSTYAGYVTRAEAETITPVDETLPFSEQTAEGVRDGDPDALAEVYRALIGPLTAYLRTQVRDRHIATDLAQETFIELVRASRTLTGGPAQIRAWIYRAAQRNVIDYTRYRGRRPEDLVEAAPEVPSSERGPAEQAVESDDAAQLRTALARLSPDQAQVLTLRFLAGLSAPEVAAVIGKAEGAVRALQHRGAASLARILRAQAVLKEQRETPNKLRVVPPVEAR